MGFMDRAKKLADQGKTKFDEVQQQVNQQMNQRGGSQPGAPVTEYDRHGRPVAPQQSASPTHGDAVAGSPGASEATQSRPRPDPAAPGWSAPSTSAGGAPATPGLPPTEPPSGPPAPVEGTSTPPPMPGAPGADDDRNRPDYTPPKLTGGDPLAG